MKILVIGSSGFLGRHLMEQGSVIGHEMFGCDMTGHPNIKTRAEYLSRTHVAGFDRMIYSAGVLGTSETLQSPLHTLGQNVGSVLNVLEVCRASEVPFTYLTLGNNWLNPYSITKNCAAEFVRMFNAVHGLPTQVAVCYNVFGPYQKWAPVRKIVPEFMTRMLSGKHVELFDCGNQMCDCVYAPDVARAIIESDKTGIEHYGSSIARRVKDVANDCATALGVKMEFVNLGNRPGETGTAAIAPTPIPNHTPYGEAMRITADWYIKNYK